MKLLATTTLWAWLMIVSHCADAAQDAQSATLLDKGQASADLLFRALYLNAHRLDLYADVPAAGDKPRYVTNVCSPETLAAGLRERTCVVIALSKSCGDACLDFEIDERVYLAQRTLIDATLAAPCKALDQARLPESRRDSHPVAFFLSYQRSRWVLGCDSGDPATAVGSLRDGMLRVQYQRE